MSAKDFLEAAFEADDAVGFLVGPYHSPEDLDIHQVFAKPWNDVLRDTLDDLRVENNPQIITEYVNEMILETEDLDFLQLSAPVLILDARSTDFATQGAIAVTRSGSGFEIIGSYVGAQLGVSGQWRHCGIGTSLVKRRVSLCGCLPTWLLDVPAYSDGGRATHLRAFRELQITHKMQAASPEADM